MRRVFSQDKLELCVEFGNMWIPSANLPVRHKDFGYRCFPVDATPWRRALAPEFFLTYEEALARSGWTQNDAVVFPCSLPPPTGLVRLPYLTQTTWANVPFMFSFATELLLLSIAVVLSVSCLRRWFACDARRSDSVLVFKSNGSFASATLLHRSGICVTSAHAVDDDCSAFELGRMTRGAVRNGESAFEAFEGVKTRVLRRDLSLDLLVFWFDVKQLRHVRPHERMRPAWLRTTELRVDDVVSVVGYPGNGTTCVESTQTFERYATFRIKGNDAMLRGGTCTGLQRPGMSGGCVFDERGFMCGVAAAGRPTDTKKHTETDVTYHIPVVGALMVALDACKHDSSVIVSSVIAAAPSATRRKLVIPFIFSIVIAWVAHVAVLQTSRWTAQFFDFPSYEHRAWATFIAPVGVLVVQAIASHAMYAMEMNAWPTI